MNYLLDTHILLWFLTENCEKLLQNCQAILLDESNALYFSKANIWEIAIKYSLGKPDFEYDPQEIVNELLKLGFIQVDIEFNHLYAVANLPMVHKDPFDRLLIAQAELDGLKLLTVDDAILQYQKQFVFCRQRL